MAIADERVTAASGLGGGGAEGVIKRKSRSRITEGLESIIRQQFSLSNHFPKRKEA